MSDFTIFDLKRMERKQLLKLCDWYTIKLESYRKSDIINSLLKHFDSLKPKDQAQMSARVRRIKELNQEK